MRVDPVRGGDFCERQCQPRTPACPGSDFAVLVRAYSADGPGYGMTTGLTVTIGRLRGDQVTLRITMTDRG